MREFIIRAAGNIFARFGFRKTTMDEIAQAANKAKSSIYHYFESKEDVFRAIVEKESGILINEITKAINMEETHQGKLRSYFITRMKILHKLANFYSTLRDEYLKHYSFIEKIRKQHDKEEIKIVKEILQGGVEKGIFIVNDPEVTAFAIITALKGLEYPWVKENDVTKTEDRIDILLEILFNGIVKNKPGYYRKGG